MELKTKPRGVLTVQLHTHARAQRGEFMCVFFVPSGVEIKSDLAELDSLLMIQLVCHSRLRL